MVNDIFHMSGVCSHIYDSVRMVIILSFNLVTQEDRRHTGRKEGERKSFGNINWVPMVFCVLCCMILFTCFNNLCDNFQK